MPVTDFREINGEVFMNLDRAIEALRLDGRSDEYIVEWLESCRRIGVLAIARAREIIGEDLDLFGDVLFPPCE